MSIYRIAASCVLLMGLTGCATTAGPEREAATDPAVEMAAVAAASPADAKAQYRYGNLLFDLARYAEAAEAYEAAIGIEPDFADAYTNLGLCLRRMDRFEEAAVAYDRALALQPDDVVTLRNRKSLAEAANDGVAYADCVRRLAALLPGEYGEVEQLRHHFNLTFGSGIPPWVFKVFAHHDHTSTRPAKSLVRCGGHDVAPGEGIVQEAFGDEAGRVCDVGHQQSACFIRNGTHPLVIPVA